MPPAIPFRQHVPRPVGDVPSFPPPWEAAAGEDASVTLGLVRAALARAPDPGDPVPRSGQRVEAAVLVACFGDRPGDDGEASVLLIRRSSRLDRDPGHVALPGGIVEPGEVPLQAALREAEEEMGIDPADVELLGPLDVVERPRRQGAVLPFVGLLPAGPSWSPSPAEVEAVLEVPLARLLTDGVAWEERWPLGDDGADPPPVHVVRFFADEAVLGDDLVWGVTARILWDLLERVVTVAG